MRKVNGWRLALLMAGLWTAGLAPASRAADDKPTPADQQIVDALKDVINRGVDIFNPPVRGGLGDHNGCYRFFQGALLMTRAQLANHPNLQKAIDAGLRDAERLPTAYDRAFALRGVIDHVRETLNPALKKAAPTTKPPEKKPEEKKPADTKPAEKKPEEKKPVDTKPPEKKPADTKPPDKKPVDTKASTMTLWDRLGGEKNVRRVVDDFVTMAEADTKVDLTRGAKYNFTDDKAIPHLKQMLVEFISAESGGPLPYTGRNMKTVHEGMGITDAEFNAAAADLKKALEKNGAKPADIGAVLEAVERTRKDIVEPKKPDAKKDAAAPKDK